MIPREILKKIRQIELRTNRIVTAFSERGCVQSTSRSTPAISNAPTNHHALRLGLRPQPHSVEGGIQLVFWPALTCVLSSRREFQPAMPSVSPAVHPINPVAGFSKEAGRVSPSPWGEGRDEGGRRANYSNKKAYNSSLKAKSCKTGTWANAAEGNHRNADSGIVAADHREQVADVANRFAVGWDRVAQRAELVADGRERMAEWQTGRADGANQFADRLPTFADTENLSRSVGILSRMGEAGTRRAGSPWRTVVADLRNPPPQARARRFGLRNTRWHLRQVLSQLPMTRKKTRAVRTAKRTLRTRLQNAITVARTQISSLRSACQTARTARMNFLTL